jgi:hypothetical protein
VHIDITKEKYVMHINIDNHLNFALCELKLTLVSTLHISMKQEGPYHILAPSSSGFNINSTTLRPYLLLRVFTLKRCEDIQEFGVHLILSNLLNTFS